MFTIIQEFTEKYCGFRGSLFSIHPLSGCERLPANSQVIFGQPLHIGPVQRLGLPGLFGAIGVHPRVEAGPALEGTGRGAVRGAARDAFVYRQRGGAAALRASCRDRGDDLVGSAVVRAASVPHPLGPVTGDRDFLLPGELARARRQEGVCEDRWRIISHPCGGFFAGWPVPKVVSNSVGSRTL